MISGGLIIITAVTSHKRNICPSSGALGNRYAHAELKPYSESRVPLPTGLVTSPQQTATSNLLRSRQPWQSWVESRDYSSQEPSLDVPLEASLHIASFTAHPTILQAVTEAHLGNTTGDRLVWVLGDIKSAFNFTRKETVLDKLHAKRSRNLQGIARYIHYYCHPRKAALTWDGEARADTTIKAGPARVTPLVSAVRPPVEMIDRIFDTIEMSLTGRSSTVIRSTVSIYGRIKGTRANTVVSVLLFLSTGETALIIYTLVQVPSPSKTHTHTYISYT